jgi:hypothetical protein
MGAGSDMILHILTAGVVSLMKLSVIHLVGSSEGAPAAPVPITVVSMVINNGPLPFDYRRSGAVVDMAVTHIKEAFGPSVNLTHLYYDTGPDCTANNAASLTADIHTTHDVSVFIGPGKFSQLGTMSISLYL